MQHPTHQLRTYLDGELPPAEQAAVTEHLAGCPACTAALADLAEQRAAIAAHLTTADPPAIPEARQALARFHVAATLEHPERVHDSLQATGDHPSQVAILTRSIEMLRQRLFSPRFRPLLVGLTAVVCLALLFTIVPVREAAADFLGLFRVRKFAVIPINPEQVERLEGLLENAESVLGEPIITRPEGPSQDVSDAAQASELAGFRVRVPSAPPDGAYLEKFTVQTGPAVHYEVQRSTVETLLQAVGASTAGLPTTDTLTVDVDLGPGVTITYRTGGGTLSLFQTVSPDVDVPEGVDLVALSETGFQLLGIPADEARRLATTIDWSSTLVIPLPTDVGQAQEVNIDGTTGLLVEEQSDRFGQASSMLLWERDGIVYALESRNVDYTTVLHVADSLQ